MRKVKLQMQTSIDSFVAGPNRDLDWMIWEWDDNPMMEAMAEELKGVKVSGATIHFTPEHPLPA